MNKKNNKHPNNKLSELDKILIERDLNINLLSPSLGIENKNLSSTVSTSEIRIKVKNGFEQKL